MAGSLQDQLIQAGLATREQGKKAERKKRAQEQQKRHASKPGKKKKAPANTETGPDTKQRAKAQLSAKKEQDKARAKERNKAADEKALRAQLKQIILEHDVRIREKSDKDEPYNFVHGTKIKRIHVNPEQRVQLINGSLVIVNNDGLYYFVPDKIAKTIAERDPKLIILVNNEKKEEASEDDEYYAKFQVPDDLDW